MHGDTLCTVDLEYQAFRREARSPEWIDRLLAQPLAERKTAIDALRRRSEQEKRVKPAEIMDVAADEVEAVLRRYDYPRLIHGHTHRPARHMHVVDGHGCERWVLADWYQDGSYLALRRCGLPRGAARQQLNTALRGPGPLAPKSGRARDRP